MNHDLNGIDNDTLVSYNDEFDFNFENSNTQTNIPLDIHIYVNQRGRKNITIIQGLNMDKKTMKELSSKLRKKLSCSCSVKEKTNKKTNETYYILKLSGDKRYDVKEFFENKEIVNTNDKITIHGAD